MADWLLLRLPSVADANAEWLLCDGHGQPQSGVQSGLLYEAAAQAAKRQVCALVPTADVLYAQVELPAKAGAKALQMARFALEEQLLGELEHQHFALGKRNSVDARTPVAVVARESMSLWLSWLAGAGIKPEVLCAESALLPRSPMQTLALLDGDALTLVPQPLAMLTMGDTAPETPLAPPGAAISLPAADPSPLLQLVPGGDGGAAIDLSVYTTQSAWELHGSRIEALRPQLANLHVQLLGDGVLPWMAPQLSSGALLNLLQGEYQQRRSAAELWPRWKWVAALAAALLLLHVADRSYTLWQLRKAELTLDTDLSKLGEQALPGVETKPATVRRLVAQQLLSSNGNDSGVLLTTLQSLARAFGSTRDGSLRSLSLSNGTTELIFRAKDAQSLERITQALEGDGLNAAQVGGSATGGGYEGRIQIKSGASK